MSSKNFQMPRDFVSALSELDAITDAGQFRMAACAQCVSMGRPVIYTGLSEDYEILVKMTKDAKSVVYNSVCRHGSLLIGKLLIVECNKRSRIRLVVRSNNHRGMWFKGKKGARVTIDRACWPV